MRRHRGEGGQAAVELALTLPLLTLALLVVVQLALLARDVVLVHHAAREAARESAVTADRARVRAAAIAGGGLVPARLDVATTTRGRPGSRVGVTVRYRAATNVPLAGVLIPDVSLSARVTIRVEM